MLENLGKAIKKATEKIANAIFLDKNLVDSIIKDLQRALIEADVNILLVKEVTDSIKKEALNKKIKGIEKKEHLIKLLHEKLAEILGSKKELELKKRQTKVILMGLYGSGKTTTVAKLGNYFAKRGKKVALVGLDVHRPAAQEQLKQLAQKNKITYFIDAKEKDPLKIWKKFEKELKNFQLILIDTAGRHSLDNVLIKELKEISKLIKPDETILVMPSDIGQAAKKQSQDFKESFNISGVIITRMDSSAKGGGALTACKETNSRIFFITNGEKINDIEKFDPETFLSKLLGMGDLQSLIEKVKSVTDKDKQENLQKKLQEGKISLEDVIEQVKSMNSLGGFDKIKSMIPGLGGAKIPDKAIITQEEKISKWEHILKSMTELERENPEILEKETSRISRVAKGSGVNNSDIRALLKQYKMLKEMINSNFDASHGLNQKQLQKLMKKFGKVKKIRF